MAEAPAADPPPMTLAVSDAWPLTGPVLYMSLYSSWMGSLAAECELEEGFMRPSAFSPPSCPTTLSLNLLRLRPFLDVGEGGRSRKLEELVVEPSKLLEAVEDAAEVSICSLRHSSWSVFTSIMGVTSLFQLCCESGLLAWKKDCDPSLWRR